MSSLHFLLTWLAPNVALAVSFLLAWLAPDFPGAATGADCRSILILQGLSILAVVLVGGYRETAMTFLPLVLGICVLWLFATGMAGLSWAWLGFVWQVIGAFMDALKAHKGEFGLARENPDHPHRRYDRLVILYIGTTPIVPVIWLLGSPSSWAIWGTAYFGLTVAVGTVLRDWFERIPRGILRWLKRSLRDKEIEAQMGICIDCVYVQPAIPSRPGRMVRCTLSVTNSDFPEYPATPFHTCDGFRQPAEAPEQS